MNTGARVVACCLLAFSFGVRIEPALANSMDRDRFATEVLTEFGTKCPAEKEDSIYDKCILHHAKPWSFRKDMNFDGHWTIRDIKIWIDKAFFLPGDYLVFMLITQNVTTATFFELTFRHLHGWFSGLLSLSVWMLVLGVIRDGWRVVKAH